CYHSRALFSILPGLRPRATLFPYTTLFRSRWEKNRYPRHRFRNKYVSCGPEFCILKNLRSDWMTTSTHWAVIPSLRFALLIWLRSEEHTSELQSRENLVCRLLLEKKKRPRR